MTLQGNTDERGSREYNIALGQKRADAVKRMMIAARRAPKCQIETVSFGKEKPRTRATTKPRGPRTAATTSSTPASDARVTRAAAQRRVRMRALAGRVLLRRSSRCHARAALFDDDEARKRIEATNQRLAQVQKQLEDRARALEQQLKSQGLVDLFTQRRADQGRFAKLRGQIEVLTYELEQAQKRQRDLYVDLDSRAAQDRGVAQRGRATGDAGAPTPERPRVPARRLGHAAAHGALPAGASGTPGVVAAAHRPPRSTASPSSARTTPRSISSSAATTRARSRGFSAFVKTLSAEPARAVGAILGRQRAVRAQAIIARRSRRSATADSRLSRQQQGARRAAQHRDRAVRPGRQRRRAAHARGADRQVPESEAAHKAPSSGSRATLSG